MIDLCIPALTIAFSMILVLFIQVNKLDTELTIRSHSLKELEEKHDALKLKYDILNLQTTIEEYEYLTDQHLSHTIDGELTFRSNDLGGTEWFDVSEIETRVTTLKRAANKTKAKK